MTIDREPRGDIGANVLVGGLLACIPFGLFMAWYMDSASWLVFCATLIIFLS